MAVPSRAGKNPGDDPAVRRRIEKIAHRSAGEILESIRELGELGLVSKVSAELRVVGLPMMFKLYALNEEEDFFGFSPVVERDVEIDGNPSRHSMPSARTPFSSTTRSATTTAQQRSQYVDQARRWFDSLWGTLGQVRDL